MTNSFKKRVKGWLIRTGLNRLDKRLAKAFRIVSYQMRHPPYGAAVQKEVMSSIDVVRHASLALALHRIEKESLPGVFAEVGVYKGELSRFLRRVAPSRTLHLFDTFAGFPEGALEDREVDERFQDTSLEQVKRTIGDCSNVHFHQGFFPDTAAAVVGEKFSFVMLDLDKYKPTAAGLEFFYPRMVHGGYVFVHDYNSIESDGAIARAVDQFLADKPETIIDVADRCGSVMFRKM